jgi:hypothetical protein
MRDTLIDCALALMVVAIIAPGVIWWVMILWGIVQ